MITTSFLLGIFVGLVFGFVMERLFYWMRNRP
jgi:hypothetical protein